MRYGSDSLLSSRHGANHVWDPFKLQEHLAPPALLLLFVTNSRSLLLFFPKQGLMHRTPDLITGALWREIQ